MSPTRLNISISISRAQSSDWASHLIFTISTAWTAVCSASSPYDSRNARSLIYLATPLEESITALGELRNAGKTKYIGLSECSAATLRKADSSKPHHRTPPPAMYADRVAVAKIDAVQAEFSPFETLHEDDGLIPAARELDIACIAYGPLGHGWLVEDFPYNSPEDFNEDDYRRQSM